ncbi:MAG TPA: type II secretion system protein GspJ [Burkholderiales bacterium]|jgi:general secretion pathway protein J|nr:type II secretion system protein GspJ [Burkholderiales bacterium]
MKVMRGFTLIELLVTLLILSVLALVSYRGLAAVTDTREHVAQETLKWRSVASFFARFEHDVHLAMPRAVRAAAGNAPAWRGSPAPAQIPILEFSRFAAVEGIDTARRIAYGLNERQQVELWLWPGLDVAPSAVPERFPLLEGVVGFDLQYLNAALAWVNNWPATDADAAIPRAVRVRLVFATGEQVVRIFELKSS